VTVAVGMWDDYWYNHQNYYLYLEKSGRVTMIPYDYEQHPGNRDAMDRSAFDPGTQNPPGLGDVANRGVSRPLVTRILAIPAYLEKYKGYLAELIDPAKDLFRS
jgi:spore coat protein CotH